VAIKVAMVIPLTGFDEFPIRPLMREATVTNRNPKTTTNIAAIKFETMPVSAPGMGLNFSRAHIITMITAEPMITNRMERSRSVRSVSVIAACFARTSLSPALNAENIVGIVLISVIRPDAATAPAPIGRI
jgi:hypothetical protein